MENQTLTICTGRRQTGYCVRVYVYMCMNSCPHMHVRAIPILVRTQAFLFCMNAHMHIGPVSAVQPLRLLNPLRLFKFIKVSDKKINEIGICVDVCIILSVYTNTRKRLNRTHLYPSQPLLNLSSFHLLPRAKFSSLQTLRVFPPSTSVPGV